MLVPSPEFELIDIFDRRINLKDYTRVHFLEKKYEEWKSKDLEMIFFFESTKELLMSSSFHRSVSPIPIISDPHKIWYKKYAVETSGLKSVKSHLSSFFLQVFEAKKKGLPVHLMPFGCFADRSLSNAHTSAS